MYKTAGTIIAVIGMLIFGLGIILPAIISTDKVPLYGIIFLLLTGSLLVSFLFIYLMEKKKPKRKRK